MRTLIVLASLLALASPAFAGYEECDEVFPNGSFVASKLSGLRGMVVSHWRNDKENHTARNCGYSVRFVTNSGWVYTIDKMRGYELERASERPSSSAPVRRPTGVEKLDFGS